MGLPPVAVGLTVYLLLSRAGPLGELGLLYSVPAMIIAQTVLVTPLIAALARQLIADFFEKRVIAEAGAVIIVGGNINHATCVMTTTIALETSKGGVPAARPAGRADRRGTLFRRPTRRPRTPISKDGFS